MASYEAVLREVPLTFFGFGGPRANRRLFDILQNLVGRLVVIYVSTSDRAIMLEQMLSKCFIPSIHMHQMMSDQEISLVAHLVKKRVFDVLITTDLVNSVDIGTVEVIINFDFIFPDLRLYTHRTFMQVGKPTLGIHIFYETSSIDRLLNPDIVDPVDFSFEIVSKQITVARANKILSGNLLNHLQYKSGAKISVYGNSVQIVGNSVQLTRALFLTQVIVQADACSSKFSTKYFYGCSVPLSFALLISGEGQSTLKSLESRSGASINFVFDRLSCYLSSVHIILSIDGSIVQVLLCKELLGQLIGKDFVSCRYFCATTVGEVEAL